MTLTLLLDLDGTLLVNEMGAFVSAYTRALSKHMAPYADPVRMVSELLSATQKMLDNRRPDRTLKETFDAAFYPALELEELKVRSTLEAFYKNVFPTLKPFTEFRSEAVALVKEAIKRGYRIGIATNPLFPRTAIVQRIAWAGLSPDDPSISLIPSYETFHFTKPNPAFYAEFLARMGWPEGPVLMVGNDIEADIEAARRMGLPTFHIPEDGAPGSPAPDGVNPSGALADVIPWIDSQPEEALLPDYSGPQALISILRSTPAALHSLAEELPAEAWTYCPQPGEWCLAEITCHLRDVEREVNIPRLKKITDEANPFLPGMDTDPWAVERQYIVQDCMEALDAFTANRTEFLSLLEGLGREDWQRPARHAIFGPTHLWELVGFIAGHDRLHIQQAYKTIPA